MPPCSRRLAIPLLAGLALVAPQSALAHGHGPPDAQIFATNNTAVITDPADPRLDDPLTGFARDVERIVAKGGGSPRGSQLLDGVFFSSDLGTTTFERSREFDVDHVADDELHAIADTVRDRFDQESVLTFDNLRPGDTQSPSGSGTFVEGPAPVRIERRALLVAGTAQDDSATLRERHGRVSVALGDQELDFARHRFDRIRVDLGDGLDTLAVDGLDERVRASAAADRVKVAGVELQNVDNLRIAGAKDVTVDDLSATAVFQVDVDASALDRATVNASGADEQISVSRFSAGVSVLGPTFVRFENPEPTDRLTVDARGGRDIISASTDAMALTLDGGDGGNVLLGGPGNDVLLGGDGFDDARGGKGDDVIRLGANFDRSSWAPGDGNDSVDGGAGRDSVFLQGTNAAEAFGVAAAGKHVCVTRDADALDLAGVEEIDPVAGRGADTFDIGDLSGTGIALVDVSLGSGLPGGDGAADRVSVRGTDRKDAMTLTGEVVVAGTATLTGLPATVNVSHAEPTDALAIDTGAGEDTLDQSAFDPRTIGLDVQ